jgi:membrane protease YdiL (CAAX protease family)
MSTTLDQVYAGASQRRAWLGLLVLVQLLLYANGSALFGRQFPIAAVILYIQFMQWPLIIDQGLLDSLLRGSVMEYFAKYSFGFFIGLAAFLVVFTYLLRVPVAKIPYSAVMATVVFQLIFVTPAEELVFRGWLPRFYNPQGKSWRMIAGSSVGSALWMASLSLSDVFVSATFSGFHYAAYGPNAFTAFVIAFALSVIWLLATRIKMGFPFHEDGGKRPMGIPFSMGLHMGHNVGAIGILGGIVFGT